LTKIISLALFGTIARFFQARTPVLVEFTKHSDFI